MNSTDLLDDICVIYSRSIGGPGQTVEIRPGIITSPESADDLVDLMYSAEESVHAEIRDLAEHWGEYRVGAPFRQYWLPKWRALLDAVNRRRHLLLLLLHGRRLQTGLGLVARLYLRLFTRAVGPSSEGVKERFARGVLQTAGVKARSVNFFAWTRPQTRSTALTRAPARSPQGFGDLSEWRRTAAP